MDRKINVAEVICYLKYKQTNDTDKQTDKHYVTLLVYHQRTDRMIVVAGVTFFSKIQTDVTVCQINIQKDRNHVTLLYMFLP